MEEVPTAKGGGGLFVREVESRYDHSKGFSCSSGHIPFIISELSDATSLKHGVCVGFLKKLVKLTERYEVALTVLLFISIIWSIYYYSHVNPLKYSNVWFDRRITALEEKVERIESAMRHNPL